MVLMKEAKGLAVTVADTDADAAKETNWKNKVTTDQGDLIMRGKVFF